MHSRRPAPSFSALPLTRDAELRAALADAAAKLIAEQGLDLNTALARSWRTVPAAAALPRAAGPNAAEVETALHRYFAQYAATTQPLELALLRQIAQQLLAALSPFAPRLGGAVATGTANRHSDIWLYLATKDSKNIAILLLNAGIGPFTDRLDDGTETLCFVWKGQLPATRDTVALAAHARSLLGTLPGVVLALSGVNAPHYRAGLNAQALQNVLLKQRTT